MDLDPYWEYGFRSKKLLNADPIRSGSTKLPSTHPCVGRRRRWSPKWYAAESCTDSSQSSPGRSPLTKTTIIKMFFLFVKIPTACLSMTCFMIKYVFITKFQWLFLKRDSFIRLFLIINKYQSLADTVLLGRPGSALPKRIKQTYLKTDLKVDFSFLCTMYNSYWAVTHIF